MPIYLSRGTTPLIPGGGVTTSFDEILVVFILSFFILFLGLVYYCEGGFGGWRSWGGGGSGVFIITPKCIFYLPQDIAHYRGRRFFEERELVLRRITLQLN